MHNLRRYCSCQLNGYSLISNSIDFGSKIVNKVITALLLGNVNPSLCFIFCNFVTVLNKRLGLCLFSSKRDEK